MFCKMVAADLNVFALSDNTLDGVPLLALNRLKLRKLVAVMSGTKSK